MRADGTAHLVLLLGAGEVVKSTCKYPVDDVYTLLELTEPDSRAICSVELHEDAVQRLMVT